MTDNRIATRAAAAARLLLLIAGLFAGLTLAGTPGLAQNCPPDCGGGGGGDIIPDPDNPGDGQGTGDGGDGQGTGDGTGNSGDGQGTGDGTGNSGDGQGTGDGTGNGTGDSGNEPPTPPAPSPPPVVVTTPVGTPTIPVDVPSPVISSSPSVGEPFIIPTSGGGLIVGNSGNDLVVVEGGRPPAVVPPNGPDPVAGLLPPGLASAAPRVRTLVEANSIDLVQLEAAVSLYNTFQSLSQSDRQALFDFLMKGSNSATLNLLTLMEILPQTDPLNQIPNQVVAGIQQSSDGLGILKQAVGRGSFGRLGKLAGLDNRTLTDICTAAYRNSAELANCTAQVN